MQLYIIIPGPCILILTWQIKHANCNHVACIVLWWNNMFTKLYTGPCTTCQPWGAQSDCQPLQHHTSVSSWLSTWRDSHNGILLTSNYNSADKQDVYAQMSKTKTQFSDCYYRSLPVLVIKIELSNQNHQRTTLIMDCDNYKIILWYTQLEIPLLH